MKRIENGDLSGFREISAETLRKQSLTGNTEIPTKEEIQLEVGVFTPPSWCQGGNIDKCLAPCGSCEYKQNPNGLKTFRFKKVTVVDKEKYHAQKIN